MDSIRGATASRWLQRRRAIDRLIAGVAALVVAPVVAVLAWLVRRDDGGPPLIQVPRVGRDGRVFGMWKLRSMHPQSSDGLASGARLTSSTDDRITGVGRWLRALHLDELPQLINVVRGEMLLLGPRPETPEYVELDDERWHEVLVVPPGIAGPTQLVVGDWEVGVIDQDEDGTDYRDVVLPVKLALDASYVRDADPLGDLWLLFDLALSPLRSGPSRRLIDRSRRAVPEIEILLHPPAGR